MVKILQHKDVYNLAENPFPKGITKEQLDSYIKEEYGNQGLKDLAPKQATDLVFIEEFLTIRNYSGVLFPIGLVRLLVRL